ncbi:MAG: hypothetical protein CL676_10340 [Bdellovibrionaceae bacterium]|nr:hypothetical protein [Pseudobdellovibrionaceae bacterium]|tara:strand:+ start:1505 stop:1819 length:315 start_codon:yes stop_codon:yes gene_type:complete
MNFSEQQLDQIEHLLQQSMNGLHILFDHKKIAEVLKMPTENLNLFEKDNLKKIDELFQGLVQKENLSLKQLYIESLDPESFEMLLRAYFHIVDNSLRTTHEWKH